MKAKYSTSKGSRSATAKVSWLMVIVYFNAQDDLFQGMYLCQRLEAQCNIEQIYFARYGGLKAADNRVEISCETADTPLRLKRVITSWAHNWRRIKIVPRGSGSMAHALAYQSVKEIVKHANVPWQLMDVVHWMSNMSGFSYLQECTNYAELTAMFMTRMIPRPHKINFNAKNHEKAQSSARR